MMYLKYTQIDIKQIIIFNKLCIDLNIKQQKSNIMNKIAEYEVSYKYENKFHSIAPVYVYSLYIIVHIHIFSQN